MDEKIKRQIQKYIYIYTETHKKMIFYEAEIIAVFKAHNSGIFTKITS